MGIDALTCSLDGRTVKPVTNAEWQEWVSASSTRNHALDDPLIDWLDLYGAGRGFRRDTDLPGYHRRTDFLLFLFRQGNAFETAVVDHLRTLTSVVTVAQGPADIRDLRKAEETFAAMQEGVPLIHQAVLRGAETRTYGAPDLLVRSDILLQLFPGSLSPNEASVPAPDLGGAAWHYRVIDLKFTTLRFLVGGELEDGGSGWAYKVQLYIYNRALGRLQGYLPPVSYLLGRGWEQTRLGETARGISCMDRLASIPNSHVSRGKGAVAVAADAACSWVRRVRREGRSWTVLPEPSVPELRPNMANASDQPWHAAKQRIGHELADLTLLWQVGIGRRQRANAAGIYRWDDPRCGAESAGVTGEKQAPVFKAILDVNRSSDGPPVLPARVRAAEGDWRCEPSLEFYVDFETVSDLNDDFSRIPVKDGQPLIFMIGCGHVERGAWRFSCFIAEALTEAAEAAIIDAWLQHMGSVRLQLGSDDAQPLVTHWSHAEVTTLETAYNAAVARHPEKSWPSPQWFDFLKKVMKAEPVVVRGAMGFGLKAVATALRQHHFIETRWDAGPTDGLGAMVGAWWCAAEAQRLRQPLSDIPLMQEIARYNEVDCKVMMEIVRYLRAHH